MGVGLPFGVGAKVAKPDTQVLVLHGDGSYGINAMEIDTAVRHKIPVVVVISNNGGWTADAPWTRPLPKPGRNLGHTRYDRVAQELGAHGEYVEKPHDIRPALERAFASGKPAVVNVITDYKARAHDGALLGVHDVAGGRRSWPKALDGIRVLDLTQYEAGPSCTQMLAWLGAEVIKIEPPAGRARPHRALRQARRGRVVLPAAELLQEGRHAQSQVRARPRHVPRPGEDRRRAGREHGPGRDGPARASARRRCTRLNPRLIAASVKGFGGGGPYADYKSFEWIAQAMAGAMSMTGSPDGPPTKAIGGLADTGAGLHTAIGILAAIIQRQATGVGQQVEVAQQDVGGEPAPHPPARELRHRQAGARARAIARRRRRRRTSTAAAPAGPTTTSSSTAPPWRCGRR